MDPKVSRGTCRIALLALTVVLAGSLALGLVSAFAASPSPSPGAGKVVLRIGWTSEPDNLNPFIGLSSYEIWALNYSYLFGYGDHNQPTLDLAAQFPTQANGGISADGKVWTIHLRPNVRWQDGVPLTAADVAFTYTYIIKNDMANLTNYTVGIKTVTAIDPTTVRIVCTAPKADLEKAAVPILPEHIWAHVSPQVVQTSYVEQAADHRQRPLPDRGLRQGQLRRDGPQPLLVRQEAGHRPDLLRALPGRRHHGLRSEDGQHRRGLGHPRGRVQGPPVDPGFKAVAYHYYDWDYLEFNCYDKASSMGNPVLRDWRFRNALNYAIDRQQLCSVAYGGLAAPGTTIIPPKSFADPDYHWQPPAGQAYTFDLTKAGQLLTAAGYPLKNGVRLNKQGKPITLRLYSPTDSARTRSRPSSSPAGCESSDSRSSSRWSTTALSRPTSTTPTAATWKPDFDMVVWDWTGYFDPGQTLSCLTTGEIGSLNEPFWSNAQYDALNTQQSSTIDPQRARRSSGRCSRSCTSRRPGWCLRTPTTSRPTTRRSGPAGSRCSTAAGRPSTPRASSART